MKYAIKNKIWIKNGEEMFLGAGRIELLEAIEQTGSLSKAAKLMGMSYKKSWRLLDAMNKATNKPLVQTAVGGKDGGGAKLTPFGLQIIHAYKNLADDCDAFLQEKLKEFPT